MVALVEALVPYVPPLVARRYVADPAAPAAPVEERFPAAILFADVSGFTSLARRLAERGPAGAERLSSVINDYFAQLLDVLSAHGGEVVAFAGDATIVAWPGLDSEDLPLLTQRAAQCGLELMAALNGYAVAGDEVLWLRAGIGAGEVWAGTVGGVRGRWSLLVGGDPLDQMVLAERQARRGEVVLSPAAWTQVAGRLFAQPRAEGCHCLLDVRQPVPPRALEPVRLPLQAVAALRCYIPRAVMEGIEAGQIDWIASLRRVTMLFAHVADLDYTAAGVLARVQAATCAIQEVVDGYDGGLNQLVVDDKGTMVVAGWGLPGHAREDDCSRAVRAGLALLARLRELGLSAAVGIATGRAFCGHRGSERRREFAVIGDTANLAARLATSAARDTVLCDAATYQAAQPELAFHPMPPLILKGRDAPQPVYRARGERQQLGEPAELVLVGRRAERAMLAERLRCVGTDGGDVRVVILEGEPGIGKSCLAHDLLHLAGRLGIPAYVGAGDAVEQATPYFAWRPVFAGLFGLDHSVPARGVERDQVLARLEPEPELGRVAPLLNAVLSLNLPDNDLTAEMSGEVRAGNTLDLLVRLLATLAPRQGDGPAGQAGMLVVLEDAHWLDSSSWALARRVSLEVPQALVLVVMRPMGESTPGEYLKLARDSRTATVRLNPLSGEDVLELLRRRLGVSVIADEVVRFVHNRSEGNPFFAEELAYALRDADLIAVEDDTCRFRVAIEDLGSLLPGTIEDVIMARIDQLPPQHQMTLKVASVIGRLFAFRTLRDVYPIEIDKPDLAAHVNHLDQLDITPLQTPEPDLAYIFKHAITRDVTYNLMLFAQRRELHRTVALWHERTFGEDLSPYYALLAYHWEQAIGGPYGPDATSKALYYLEKAGDQALHDFANDEAATFFERVLALAAPSGIEVYNERRAHWELQLGAADAGLRQYVSAGAHLEAGLALLGQRVPGTTAVLVLNLLGQVLLQVLHRTLPSRFVGRLLHRRETLLAAFRAYEKLTEVYFFAGKTMASMYTAFRALNVSEAAGQSPELARGYASIGALLGFVPLHGIAESYLGRASDGAQRFNNFATREYVCEAAGFYYAGVGSWTKARNLFDQMLGIAQQVGDHRHWDDALSNLAPIHYYCGEFASGAGLAAALYAAGHDQVNRIDGLQWQAKCLFCMGRLEEVAVCLEKLDAALGEDSEVLNQALRIGVHGLRATTYLRQGNLRSALEAAAQTMDLAASSIPSSYGVLSGYANPAEVYLSLWEAGYPQPGLDRLARKACKVAHSFARVFPIGRPRALLWDGLHHWLAGKPARATRAWQASLAAAARLEMPYDEGLAHYELGRHLPDADPGREEHLARACEIFERLGAAYELARAREARCTTRS